ncbi:thioredoxin family protein, partial [Desulfobaculum sp.]
MTAPEEYSADSGDWFIPEESRKHLEEAFADLKGDVAIEVFTRKGENDPYNDATTGFCRDLGRLSDKIAVTFHDCDSDHAKERDVTRSPTVVLQPDAVRLRYIGAPLGEEARTFIEAVMLLSFGESRLSDVSADLMKELDEERAVKVFVSPTCPYCPGQVSNAFRAAMHRPDLVSAECVETGENPDLAEKYSANALPKTIINETFEQRGLYPEERFVAELVSLKSADELQHAMAEPKDDNV